MCLERCGIRNTFGDGIGNEVDKIGLWHIAHRSKLCKEDHIPKDPLEAISLDGDHVVLVSDTEEAEGLAPEEDDNQDPPMDLNK